jgi:hypothetical protein
LLKNAACAFPCFGIQHKLAVVWVSPNSTILCGDSDQPTKQRATRSRRSKFFNENVERRLRYSVLGTGDPTSEQLFVLNAKVNAVKMNDFIG